MATLSHATHFDMPSLQAPTIQDATTADAFAVDSETPVQLPASYCVDLVTIIPTQSLPSLSQFLSSLLPSEVEAVPRGTVSSVLRQSRDQSPLERAVKGVENLLLGMCVVNSGRDSPHGMVASKVIMLKWHMNVLVKLYTTIVDTLMQIIVTLYAIFI